MSKPIPDKLDKVKKLDSFKGCLKRKTKNKQCVKSVQIRSFFCSLFSCIRTRETSVFGHFSSSETNKILRMFWKSFSVKTLM